MNNGSARYIKCLSVASLERFNKMNIHRNILCLCIVMLINACTATQACTQERWFVSLYGGRFSDNALLDVVRFQAEFKDSHVYVLSVGKELERYYSHLAIEFEGQLAFHRGMQEHEEINGVFALRWHTPPWDRLVDSSIAIGNGLSYATTEPPLEKMDQKDNKASKLLYYLYVELAFTPFRSAQWDLFVRVHHRSGVFGLIHGIDSGSNFIGIGARYYFGK